MRRIYLDHNASSPLRPAVRDAMIGALELIGNPSSIHAEGRACRAAVELARGRVAALAGVPATEVIFTAGGTEANALAFKGVEADTFLVSAIEHDSVLSAAPRAVRVPVDVHGLIDLEALDRALAAASGRTLVSVMLVNNETGVIQPVAEVARTAHAWNALVHCDASQAPGRLALDREFLGVDLLSLSSHKLGGPAGVGALIVAPELTLHPLITGGGQERGRRAGSENLTGIVGFGRAAEAVMAGDETERLTGLREHLEHEVRSGTPAVRVLGASAPRVCNTSCLALPGLPAETQVIALDLAGVAVSAGAACSSGKVRRSHVLTAMGINPALAGSAIRVSLGWNTTPTDIERFLEAWQAMARGTRPPPHG